MRLNGYTHKPRPLFRGERGKDGYYLGLELEVEAPTSEAMQQGLDLARRPRHYYAKRDASLGSYGWEIVTHPISRDLWLDKKLPATHPVHKFLELVSGLKGMGYKSHEGGRCGLHIHLCQTAFGERREQSLHFYWFAKLVNGALFAKLSQRERERLNRWAVMSQPRLVSRACSVYVTHERNSYTASPRYGMNYGDLRVPSVRAISVIGANNTHGRYSALNLTDNTVEVRIWRGNMREDRIRKCVEATIAAVEFSRGMSSKNWSQRYVLDALFVTWVKSPANAARYPNLAKYLDEMNSAQAEREDLVCA